MYLSMRLCGSRSNALQLNIQVCILRSPVERCFVMTVDLHRRTPCLRRWNTSMLACVACSPGNLYTLLLVWVAMMDYCIIVGNPRYMAEKCIIQTQYYLATISTVLPKLLHTIFWLWLCACFQTSTRHQIIFLFCFASLLASNIRRQITQFYHFGIGFVFCLVKKR